MELGGQVELGGRVELRDVLMPLFPCLWPPAEVRPPRSTCLQPGGAEEVEE